MSELTTIVESFWRWMCLDEPQSYYEEKVIPFDPLSFPEFETMRNLCISMVNASLTDEEINTFLFCMALDSEDECILDACKESANPEFLSELVRVGVTFPYSEARWQMAELLRGNIPHKTQYLQMLLADSDRYVRKRANNVFQEN